MKQYYFSNGGEPLGPLSLNDLAKQPLNAKTLVWHDGLSQWQSASTLPELQGFLPRMPPPLPFAQAPSSDSPPISPSPPPVPKPSVTPSAQQISTQRISNVTLRKYRWVISGVVVLFVVLLLAFMNEQAKRKEAQRPAAWLDTQQREATQQAAIQQEAQQREVQQREAAQQETQQREAAQREAQQREAAQREAQHEWYRTHFLEYVSAEILPGYNVDLTGGINNGFTRFTNNSGFNLRGVITSVSYIKQNGELYTTKEVFMGNIPAHSSATNAIPETSRGVKVIADIGRFEVPGLAYTYDPQGEADAATAKADAEAEAEYFRNHK